MNFLFWNLQKDNSFFDDICEMVRENSIGVAMFAEFPNGEQERLLRELKKVNSSFRYLQSIVPAKVEVFKLFPQVNCSLYMMSVVLQLNVILVDH